VTQSKPTILIPTGVYLPGYKGGGPIHSISNLVEAISSEFEFRVLTSAANLKEGAKEVSTSTGEWKKLGGAYVRYLTSDERTFRTLTEFIVDIGPEVVYLNAFFPTPFTLPVLVLNRLGLLDSKVVLAPRGQFYPGAINQKRWKKQLFIGLSKITGLYEDIIWQATSDAERQQIKQIFGDESNIRTAPNLGTLPKKPFDETPDWSTTEKGKLDVIFISRISRKKNLDEAIRLLEEVSGDLNFKIVGPIWDEDYWEECQPLIEQLPDETDVDYLGAVPHEKVFELFQSHDLFLFPTKSENFGHVIFESLISGCPVLTSKETPWQDLEDERAGWTKSLQEPEAFVQVLQACVDAKESAFRGFREGALSFARKQARQPEAIEQNRELFESAIKEQADE
jgi:glycosyltransferase involved in cell wall biosynthesis